MSAAKMDIYLIGVGGQGIGFMSEVLLRAADHAGLTVRGVDTHGLSQRGGTVISHVRIGAQAHAALVQVGCADMVVALERNEAFRGLTSYLADGGTLAYYDTEWQPLVIRLGKEPRLQPEVISAECVRRGIREIRVTPAELDDPQMQNVALLASVAKQNLVPGVTPADYEQAISDLLEGNSLDRNLTVFRKIIAG